MVKNLNFFLNYSMFLSRFPSLGQYYYPPAQPQPQPNGNGSMLPQPRLGYMMYDSTSPDFQQQPSAGQMMMLPQLTTPPMYRFPQQQPPAAIHLCAATQCNTSSRCYSPPDSKFHSGSVSSPTGYSCHNPQLCPLLLPTEQNEETPPSSSEKNRSNQKRQKDKNKDNEIEKKGHGDNDVLKDGKCDTSLESKEKLPLAQKLSDDDDSIVYLKMHSSFLSRPKIQKLLQESQQNSNEQLGSNASKSTRLDQTSQQIYKIRSNQPVATDCYKHPAAHWYQVYQHNINFPPLCSLPVQFNQFN